MKTLITLLFITCCLNSQAQTLTLTPGSAAPAIKLKNINGKTVSFADYPLAKGFIIAFICNTCPYSKAYEQRVIALNNKFSPLGFPVIAINPNDAQISNGDSFTDMKTYAKSKGFNFPYLYDEGQVVTSAYGAKSTPHLFILSKNENAITVEYTGALDNDTPDTDPSKIKYAEEAVNALLEKKKPALAVTRAIGCRVKWKKS
ncbi:MAG: thioredoxin family protein [Ginsengibacter sp.]